MFACFLKFKNKRMLQKIPIDKYIKINIKVLPNFNRIGYLNGCGRLLFNESFWGMLNSDNLFIFMLLCGAPK
jgi:hypothetical protein